MKKNKDKTITIRFGGEGGEGIISAGEIVSLAAARSGWQLFSTRTYPAEIKGGLAIYQLRIGVEPVHSQGDRLDAVVCLTKEAWDTFAGDADNKTLVIYDPAEINEHFLTEHIRKLPIDFTDIAKKQLGSAMVKSAVVVGVLGQLLGLSPDVIIAAFTSKFGGKRTDLLPTNLKAIDTGYSAAGVSEESLRLTATPDNTRRLMLSGNQAMALGALAADCKYVAGYPITPATPLLEMMARELPKFGGSFVQTEDEIAALASCIGAGYTGVRAMTATSGPGFALMSELTNLSVMAEVPVVIVNVQRAGPSTGMPTKTEQGDLLYALYGSPGESPRPVLAPATVTEAYSLMADAFLAAEKAQCPVIVLSDQSLGYRLETVDPPKLSKTEISLNEENYDGQPYRRYLHTESGVSPVVKPGGSSPVFLAGGLEHDESGQPDYTAENHQKMATKRQRKLLMIHSLPSWRLGVERAGEQNGVGIISWGSTFGVISEAIDLLELQTDKHYGHYHLRWLNPFPLDGLKQWADKFDKLIVVEENFSGQLAQLVNAKTNLDCESLRKSAGIPFSANEVVTGILEHIGIESEEKVGESIRL